MSHVYICEISGNDETGKGSQESPFKTPLAAVEFLSGNTENAKILVRKTAEGTFEDIAATALKKAKKGYEIAQKKLAKANERAEANSAAAEKVFFKTYPGCRRGSIAFGRSQKDCLETGQFFADCKDHKNWRVHSC